MKRKLFNRYFILILVLILTLLGSITYVAAKYISEKYFRTSIIDPTGFYFTSDYATSEGATYTTSDWVNGIKIRVYNYDIDNQNNVSESDILYKIEIPNDWSVKVFDDQNADVNLEDSNYRMKKAGNNYHDIKIKYIGSSSLPLEFEIKIITNSPYNKELKATFIPENKNLPLYTITDMGNYVMVNIKTNAFKGNVTVDWDENKFSPDNTNPIMSSWLDIKSQESFFVDEYSTYELIFVKKTFETYTTVSKETTLIEVK